MNLGKAGENKAVEYLDKKGYQILRRNYRCKAGEIDIIALDGSTLCFIEVKTRTSMRHGMPGESVDMRKLQHIRRTAAVYMSRFKHDCESVRIEVIEVLFIKKRFYVRHIRNIYAA